MWAEWVDGVRGGDAAARDELTNYFTPFVHGALLCHVALHAANQNVKSVLDDALARLSEAPAASEELGAWLVKQAHARGASLAKTSSTTLELPAGATLAEGQKILSKLRQLPEPTRERLIFRLLEGITGAEISEVTGAPPNEVRGDLERGVAALLKELSGLSITATGDTYLWSLVGTPHSAVVPLENQLTPLRYDPSAPESVPDDPSATFTSDVTPGPGRSPLENTTEGRRPTGELKIVQPVPAEDGDGTTPVGVPLVEDPTSVAPGSDERTRNATDLPVAAQQNPFAAQPGTIQVSDLPVAAAIATPPPVSSPPVPRRRTHDEVRATPISPEETRQAPATVNRSRTGEVPATVKRDPAPKQEPDSTAPRGVPLSVLARRSGETPVVEEPSTGSAPVVEEPSSGSGVALGQDWRTSIADVRPPPRPAPAQPFSLMRGATPIVMAGILLVIAGALVYTLLVTSRRAATRGWNLVPVTVAAVNIPEGTIVDFSMISQRSVPEQFITASVIKPDSVSYIERQRIMVPVQAGDPLLWSQFETSKASERLSHKVQKKARAYTIRADAISSVGGWVQPGDHVDLVVSIQDPNKKERNAAIRMQNVIVLATGKITQTTNTGLLPTGQKRYHDVSVLALPEEIEILALMREKASYRMLLRNEDDVDIVEDRLGAAPSTLLNGERVMLLGKKRAATIEMIRGSSPQVPVPRR